MNASRSMDVCATSERMNVSEEERGVRRQSAGCGVAGDRVYGVGVRGSCSRRELKSIEMIES